MFTQNDSGMRVYSITFGWGTITTFPSTDMFYVKFDNGATTDFYLDGRSTRDQVFPELYFDVPQIIAPPRPKKKVTKTIERWTSLYKDKSNNKEYTNGIWLGKEGALSYKMDSYDFISVVKLIGSYEFEE